MVPFSHNDPSSFPSPNIDSNFQLLPLAYSSVSSESTTVHKVQKSGHPFHHLYETLQHLLTIDANCLLRDSRNSGKLARPLLRRNTKHAQPVLVSRQVTRLPPGMTFHIARGRNNSPDLRDKSATN
ncbi:hypothetical protein Bbelb_153790 [Branchiostoma belcheri]|nr:hypothetical protein Bbelb_153790 [Branchiostoma belcheri]